jgi:hypothetical protein
MPIGVDIDGLRLLLEGWTVLEVGPTSKHDASVVQLLITRNGQNRTLCLRATDLFGWVSEEAGKLDSSREIFSSIEDMVADITWNSVTDLTPVKNFAHRLIGFRSNSLNREWWVTMTAIRQAPIGALITTEGLWERLGVLLSEGNDLWTAVEIIGQENPARTD